ncbi:MAG TPA: hypothetical protein VFN35_11745 [Ktedonobacteraceae bacterium]|nr:hypothetical protein [Ktedonobacteraceae bacterium]
MQVYLRRRRRQSEERNWGHPNPRQGRCPWTPLKELALRVSYDPE